MHKKKKIRKCKRGQKFCKNVKCPEMIPIHCFICPHCNFINEKKKKKSCQEEIKNVKSLIKQVESGASLNKKNLQALKAYYLNQIFEVSIFVRRDQVPRQEFLTDKGSFYMSNLENQNFQKDFQFETEIFENLIQNKKNKNQSIIFGKLKIDVDYLDFFVNSKKDKIGFLNVGYNCTNIKTINLNDQVYIFMQLTEQDSNKNRFEQVNILKDDIQSKCKLLISKFDSKKFTIQNLVLFDNIDDIQDFEIDKKLIIKKDFLQFQSYQLLKNGKFQIMNIQLSFKNSQEKSLLELEEQFEIKENFITSFEVNLLSNTTQILLGTIAGEIYQYCKYNDQKECQLIRVYNLSQNFCIKEITSKLFKNKDEEILFFAVCTQDGFIKVFQSGQKQPKFFQKLSNKPIKNLFWDSNPSIIFFRDEQEEFCLGAFSFNINQNSEGEQTESF